MIETIVAAIMALSVTQASELTLIKPVMNAAPATVNEVIIGNIPKPTLSEKQPEVEVTPETVITETEAPAPERAVAEETPAEEFYSEPQEELPPPADSFEETNMTPLGVYHVTHYSAEACGNAIGAAGVEGGLVEGLSCAMPEAWMLGRTVLIENYGFYRVDDISPDGVVDIFHWYEKDAIGEDWQMVYLVK